MQLQRVKIVLILIFAPKILIFGQDITYKLKSIDSVSFQNYYYFEFKNKMQRYVVISEKKDSVFTDNNCYHELKRKEVYRLNLDRIFFLEVENSDFGTIYYDLIRVRFKKGKKQIGGKIPVYMCEAIFKKQISCEYLVVRKI